jgi:hypothetical protein
LRRYEQYFSMAMSYIEIGKITSKTNWISERLPNGCCIGNVTRMSTVGDYQNAVAYQLFHAIELFLKYAILCKGECCWGHNVGDLYRKYKSLYPSLIFHFEHPFDFSIYATAQGNECENELAQRHVEKYKLDILDQHLRYPHDDKTGGYSFSISSNYFEKMEKTFLTLHSNINNNS